MRGVVRLVITSLRARLLGLVCFHSRGSLVYSPSRFDYFLILR